MKNMWDKKANNYQRYNGKLGEFQAKFFEVLHNYGINFTDKTLVDIGCGTGVYTLYLATKCAHITGVDNSRGMLEILKEDADKFDIKNLSLICKPWSEFKSDKSYDIVFCTMSPAIQSEADFAKFNTLGNEKIYLGWAKPRSSDLLEPFFEKYGRKTTNFIVANKLKSWLEAQNIKFKHEILSETRLVTRKFDQAFENICWHLEINELVYDKNEVYVMLEKMCKNGEINEKIDSLMSVFVF
ncbi:class I SAM-dependent methyltransferase [Campylobacter sp. 7477a]|uniref:class I SAM-dependent methyltransferase n=1 Tax=Campylobacter sp. 7477a TaxID=2735741 RepID=UPI0030155726|nr:class I SAM-dependent methyltransferase [Campylobacter sp. 7477a]